MKRAMIIVHRWLRALSWPMYEKYLPFLRGLVFGDIYRLGDALQLEDSDSDEVELD